MRIIDRLDQYAKFARLNDNAICQRAGLAVGTLTKARQKDLTRHSAEKVLATFDDINPDWLIKGAGDMLKPSRNVDALSVILEQQKALRAQMEQLERLITYITKNQNDFRTT